MSNNESANSRYAVRGITRSLQRQLDRFAEQMSPAFLRFTETLVDGGIITDQNAGERRFVDNLLQRPAIFMHAVEHHGQRIR